MQAASHRCNRWWIRRDSTTSRIRRDSTISSAKSERSSGEWSTTVRFRWVRGHSDIEGNELTDAVALLASYEEGVAVRIQAPFSSTRRELRSLEMLSWKNEISGTVGTCPRNFVDLPLDLLLDPVGSANVKKRTSIGLLKPGSNNSNGSNGLIKPIKPNRNDRLVCSYHKVWFTTYSLLNPLDNWLTLLYNMRSFLIAACLGKFSNIGCSNRETENSGQSLIRVRSPVVIHRLLLD